MFKNRFKTQDPRQENWNRGKLESFGCPAEFISASLLLTTDSETRYPNLGTLLDISTLFY